MYGWVVAIYSSVFYSFYLIFYFFSPTFHKHEKNAEMYKGNKTIVAYMIYPAIIFDFFLVQLMNDSYGILFYIVFSKETSQGWLFMKKETIDLTFWILIFRVGYNE